ncbi:hypothetical protein AOT41_08055 [Limosilactobacillus fermentum]|nr:hypothetical protein AOT41_08055 [Limosilactobacillus fermentum]
MSCPLFFCRKAILDVFGRGSELFFFSSGKVQVSVIRIFPNDLSVLRLMGALLIEQNEKWAAGPRYLNMTVYHGIEKDDNSEEAGMLKLVK